MVYLFIITGWRNYSVGTDTVNYVSFFDFLGNDTIHIDFFDITTMLHSRFEYGYILLDKMIYYFTSNPRWLLIISSFIVYFALFIFTKILSGDIYLTIMMFVSIGYMASAMNTVRQSIAIAFVMIAYIFLLKYRRVIPFITMVIGGFLFHKTAFVFIIAILVRNWKCTRKNSVILLASSLVVASIYGKFKSYIDTINYTDYANSGITSGYLGIFFNIFLLVFFLIIGFVSKKNSNRELWNKYFPNNSDEILPIFIIISIGIYIVALNFSQLTRIASYFELATIIYIPNAISAINSKQLRVGFVILMYAVLFLYFFIILIYRPHWTNITPYIFG